MARRSARRTRIQPEAACHGRARPRSRGLVAAVSTIAMLALAPAASAALPPLGQPLDYGPFSRRARLEQHTYINSGGSPHSMAGIGAQRPRSVYFGYSGRGSVSITGYISDLKWPSWGDARASATGTVTVQWTRSRKTVPVESKDETAGEMTITLGRRVNCAGQLLYTHYTLKPARGVRRPRFFRLFESGGAPCLLTVRSLRFGGGGFRPFIVKYPYEKNMWCGELMAPPRVVHVGGCWKVRDWNTPRATGVGFIRLGVPLGRRGGFDPIDYGVRVRFTQPSWCHGSRRAGTSGGMYYLRQQIVVYGMGIRSHHAGHLPRATWRRLRRMIDTPGARRRTLWAKGKRSWHCDVWSKGS